MDDFHCEDERLWIGLPVLAVLHFSASSALLVQPLMKTSLNAFMFAETQEFAAKGSFIQYGGVVDHALVVRGITTVYNTDYITDFTFHLNGAIKVNSPTFPQ